MVVFAAFNGDKRKPQATMYEYSTVVPRNCRPVLCTTPSILYCILGSTVYLYYIVPVGQT